MKNAIYFLPLLFLSIFSISQVFGQSNPPVFSFDQEMAAVTAGSENFQEMLRLDQLVNDPEAMLSISNNDIRAYGSGTPQAVMTGSQWLDRLYQPHADFGGIQLVSIRVDNQQDLNQILDLDQLSHFQELDYIFFLITFELCPDGDIDCEKSAVGNMVRSSQPENSPRVFYQVSPLM